MIIYGVGLLALSCLGGLVLGDALGALLGVKANVGGVGFAMLFLIYATDWLRRRDLFQPLSVNGVLFWSGMYIPVVIAMAAQQNVLGAIRGGPLAIIAGATGVVVCFAMVPVLARLGRPPSARAADAASRKEVS